MDIHKTLVRCATCSDTCAQCSDTQFPDSTQAERQMCCKDIYYTQYNAWTAANMQRRVYGC
jgi:hypothetical protein